MPNNKKKRMNRRKTNRRKRQTTRNLEQNLFSQHKDTYILPKRYRVMPPSLITRLVFQSTAHSPLNNAGATFASVRFRPSSAFDVDPALGGTSMPGFNEVAGIYGRYRCLRFRADVTGVNLEANPVNMIVFMSNFDLGNNYSQVQSQFGNTFSRYRYLSPQGGMDRATIRTPWWSITEYVGSDAPMVDTDFSASISSSPTNNTFLNIGVWTGNANTLVNGVGMQIVIVGEYKFYEPSHLVVQPDPIELHPELTSTNPDLVQVRKLLTTLKL